MFCEWMSSKDLICLRNTVFKTSIFQNLLNLDEWALIQLWFTQSCVSGVSPFAPSLTFTQRVDLKKNANTFRVGGGRVCAQKQFGSLVCGKEQRTSDLVFNLRPPYVSDTHSLLLHFCFVILFIYVRI